MRRNQKNGAWPLDRPRTWLESERNLTKASRKSTWAKVGRTPEATISPVKVGEGLLAKPSVGGVSVEESMVGGKAATNNTKKTIA